MLNIEKHIATDKDGDLKYNRFHWWRLPAYLLSYLVDLVLVGSGWRDTLVEVNYELDRRNRNWFWSRWV